MEEGERKKSKALKKLEIVTEKIHQKKFEAKYELKNKPQLNRKNKPTILKMMSNRKKNSSVY